MMSDGSASVFAHMLWTFNVTCLFYPTLLPIKVEDTFGWLLQVKKALTFQGFQVTTYILRDD